MNGKTGNGCEVATCGVSISPDRTRVTIYLGDVESDESFEFVMPKDLAVHMSNTIQRLVNPSGVPRGVKTVIKP